MTATAAIKNIPIQINEFGQNVKKKWEEVLPKITDVAKKVFYVLLGMALFATNPTVFAIAFIAGIIWDKKVEEVSKKVEAIWKQKTLPLAIGTVISAILCIQVTWAAASVYYASTLASHLTRQALTP